MEIDVIMRVMDANLNRAREGLRVIEDTARFIINDTTLCRRSRNIRHALDDVTREIYQDLLKARNSAADTGRKFTESGRTSVKSIMAANFRRTEEALRVLEEFSKLLEDKHKGTKAQRHIADNGKFHSALKELRYKTYDLEKKVTELQG